jgi:hypothetical protein
MNGRDDLNNPQHRLPQLTLVSARTGAPRPLRDRGRIAPAIVVAHNGGCRQCDAFLGRLALERQSFLDWGGEVVVVRSGVRCTEYDGGPAAESPFPVLLDRDGLLARALAIEVPAVVIADQWSVIHCAEQAGPEHRFITPAEISDWMKYLAVLCPECEGESL